MTVGLGQLCLALATRVLQVLLSYQFKNLVCYAGEVKLDTCDASQELDGCKTHMTQPHLGPIIAYQVVPAMDVKIGRRIGAGTEKVIYVAKWAGEQVAAMEILGTSKMRDFALQRRIAEHARLAMHPNIVRVLGETSDRRYILNEFAVMGSLTNYDGSASVLTRSDLGVKSSVAVRLAIALQISAASLAFMSAGLLHRDLAARNVLCFGFSRSDPEQVLVKITDFGLMIELGEDPAWPRGHAMGTRWMAPESMPEANFEFSEKSEVYNLGVVLWEVFSNGRVPYASYTNDEIPLLKKRGVLPGPRPPTSTDAVWQLMQLCWEQLPVNRPSIEEVHAMLTQLRKSNGKLLRPEPLDHGPWILRHSAVGLLDEEMMAPEFKAMALAAPKGWEAMLAAANGVAVAHDEALGVYSFPMFSTTFCDIIVSELTAFVASGRQTSRANTNNRHSLLLGEIGFDPMLEAVTARYTQPFARALLPGFSESKLRYKQGHTVQRVVDGAASPLPGSNRGSKHYDGSDVTINVNIGGDWGGGDLLIYASDHASQPKLRVPQRKGWAIFQPSRVMHQAALLESGYRYNLVIWADNVA